jgi:hypothetical protein
MDLDCEYCGRHKGWGREKVFQSLAIVIPNTSHKLDIRVSDLLYCSSAYQGWVKAEYSLSAAVMAWPRVFDGMLCA